MKDPIIETVAAQLGIEFHVQSEALDRCPSLKDALAFVLDARDDNPDVAKGDVGRGQRFSIAQPGLGLLHWAPYGILLKLPGELNGCFDKRVSKKGPAILNLCTVDMRYGLTMSAHGRGGTHESTVLGSLRTFEEIYQPFGHHFGWRTKLYLPIVVIVGDNHVDHVDHVYHVYVTEEGKGLTLQGTGIGGFVGEAV